MSINLFEPYRIGNLEVKNRFMRSATWDATADDSGAVTDKSLSIYKRLAEGGVGLIVTGFAFVSAPGQAMHGQYGVHNDAMIPGLRKLAAVAHQGGAKITLQIVHCGISSAYLPQKGVSLLAVSKKPDLKTVHHEMTEDDIESIIADFTAAAVRAREAGFDTVQLHGAHGYLISQFLSPLYNQRTDKWGGNAENRRRFVIEIIRRIRLTTGNDFPLMIKFGVMDDEKAGLSLDEGLETAGQMVKYGMNAIEVSSGIGRPADATKENEPERAYHRERAAALKRAVNIPVMVVGGIRTLQMSQDIIDRGDSDMVSMCRTFIREPDLIARWQRGDIKPAKCISCQKCFAMPSKTGMVDCWQEYRGTNKF